MKLKQTAVVLASMMLSASASMAATANVSVSFGQPVTSPQQQAGGAAMTMNGGDTVNLTSTVLNDAVFLDTTSTAPATAQGATTTTTTTAPKRVPSASIAPTAFFSPYLKIYSVPLTWTFFGKLKTELSLPYVDRTLKQEGVSYSANGFGDMSFGLDYAVLNDETWDISTVVGSTFPTGDVEAKGSANGKTITVPLGSGAYSVNLTQNVSYKVTPALRAFGSGTFRYFTDADSMFYATADGQCAPGQAYCQKHEEKGLMVSGMLGAEYKFIENMSVTGRFSVVDVEQGKQSFNGGGLVSSDDSLVAGDASLTYKWRFWGNATAAVTGVFPVFTQFDANVKNPEDRTWGVSGTLMTQF